MHIRLPIGIDNAQYIFDPSIQRVRCINYMIRPICISLPAQSELVFKQWFKVHKIRMITYSNTRICPCIDKMQICIEHLLYSGIICDAKILTSLVEFSQHSLIYFVN